VLIAVETLRTRQSKKSDDKPLIVDSANAAKLKFFVLRMARRKRKNSRPIGRTRRILAGLILAALIWPFYILAGKALCHIALGQIGGLTNTKIKTESVSFSTDGSVLIKKLVISPSKQENGDNAILKASVVVEPPSESD